MQQTIQTGYGLHDIEPLAAPPQSNMPAGVAALLLGAVLIALIIRTVRHFKSHRARARRDLWQLRNSVVQQDTDSSLHKETAFQLACILSQGLGVNGITNSLPLPAELGQYHERWQQFIQDLSTLRFGSQSSRPGKSGNTGKMFDDAFFWLKVWP